MKKKVLFALIALFSFVGAWAQGTTTEVDAGGGYKATLNQAVSYVLQGQGLPEVTGITHDGDPVQGTIAPALDGTYKVYKPANPGVELVTKQNTSAEGDALPVGNYYLGFTVAGSQKLYTVYVPFQVVKVLTNADYDYVHNEESYYASYTTGGLVNYYKEYPWSDWGTMSDNTITLYQPNNLDWFKDHSYDDRLAWWNATKEGTITNGEDVVANNGNPLTRNWQIAIKHPKNEPFPWIVLKGFTENSEEVRPYFTYDGVASKNGGYPWGTRVFGGPTGKRYGVASVSTEFNTPAWAQTAADDGTEFDVSKFQVMLVPTTASETYTVDAQDRVDITQNANFTVTVPQTFVFNNEVQKPVFTEIPGDDSQQIPATPVNATVTYNNTTLVEGTDFTVSYLWDTDDNDATDYISAGQGANAKPFTITGIGLYKGTVSGTYPISPKALTADNFLMKDRATEVTITTTPIEFTYDGTNKAPIVSGQVLFSDATSAPITALTAGTDFDVTLYKDGTTPTEITNGEAKNAGSYYYVITPKGNYSNGGTAIQKAFTINPANLSGCTVILPTYTYNTQEQKPKFAATTTLPVVPADAYVLPTAPADPANLTADEKAAALVLGTDFTVAFPGTDYINAGTDKAFTITGAGNYIGISTIPSTINGTYEIAPKDITSQDVSKQFVNPTYDGGELVLTQGNFNFVYGDDNPLELGDATTTKDFTWAWDTSSINPSDYENEDAYNTAIENYKTSAGQKKITVTGTGNYTGEYPLTFSLAAFTVTITPANLTKVYGDEDPEPNFSVDANSATQIPYGGDEWKYIQSFLRVERAAVDPSNAEELKENVGSHQYIIKPKAATLDDCNYKIVINNSPGSLTIYPAPLTVTIAQDSKVYSGNPATDPNFLTDKDATHKFKITTPKRENGQYVLGADPVDVTNAKDFVDETKDLKNVLNIGRKPGEDVKDSPYDFTWDNDNYDVTFLTYNKNNDNVEEVSASTGFKIIPKGIVISVAFNSDGYQYKGHDWNPVPTVTATIDGTETTLTWKKDFQVAWFNGSGEGNTLRDVTLGSNSNTWPYATISQVEKGNYTFETKTNQHFKITPATLKIASISDNGKYYGEPEPNPLAMVTFVPEFAPLGTDYWRYNTETEALETNIDLRKASNHNVTAPLIVREEGEHVGNYVISKNPDLWTRNYNIESTVTGKFHIYLSENTIVISFTNPDVIQYDTPFDLKEFVKVTAPTGVNTADLLADAKANVKKYQKLDPETGEVDNVDGVKTYVETNNVGTYTLTIDDAPTAFQGYHVEVVEKGLTIGYFPLYIIANDSKEYGDEEPTTYDWDVYELVTVGNVSKYVLTERDDEFTVPEADLIGNTGNWMADAYRYTISRANEGKNDAQQTVTGEAVGHYATTIRNYRSIPFSWSGKEYGTQYDGNYSFTFAQGDFEITRRNLTVTVTGASKFYGEYDPVIGERLPVIEEEEAEEPEEEEEETSLTLKFQKGLVIIEVVNAVNADEAYEIADKVTYQSRQPGEVHTANGYAVNNIRFNSLSDPSTTILPNYNLTFVKSPANFMINKRLLKVLAHDQSVPYAVPVDVDPYDLSIIKGIVIDGQYVVAADDDLDGIDVNYDDIVTRMPKANATNNVAINDRVDQVFKPLTVVEGKTAVGKFHRDAFVLDLTDAAKQNYELEFFNGKLYIEQLNDLYLDTKNLAQVLNDHIGRKVTVHMAGAPVKEDDCDPFRQFVAYDWNTLVLPFTAMPREIVAPFRYGVIDILNPDYADANNFSFAVTTKRVPANTPFIIQTDKNMQYAAMLGVYWDGPDHQGVEIADFDYLNKNPEAKDKAGNKFIGTYGPKSDFTAANYIMARSDESGLNEFFRFIAGADGVEPSYAMRQTEAYLESALGASAAPARIYIDEEDGTTTVIEFVGAEGVATTSNAAEGWYTINGVKLTSEPTVSGTYIYNGKKVFFQAK